MSTSEVGISRRAPLWPVVIAPVVTCVYYLAIKGAFYISIDAAVGTSATGNIEMNDLTVPKWGSHWIYRGAAEFVSSGFAIFVAAGLARGRERAAAIAGGVTIAALALAATVVAIYVQTNAVGDYAKLEQWPQYLINGILLIGCSLIGFYVKNFPNAINEKQITGFFGINRIHFLWLWLAAYLYGIGLIPPIFRFNVLQLNFPGAFQSLIYAIEYVIPAVALLIPAYFGICLLSRNKGESLHPIVRNLLGVFVLLVGFFVGATFQSIWGNLLRWMVR